MMKTALLISGLLAVSLFAACAKNPPPAPDYPVDDEYFQTTEFELQFPELATVGGDSAETPEEAPAEEEAEKH